MDTDFPSLMVPVVRRLRGNPNEELSTKEQLRWGTKGSLAVKVKEGVWYDHEMKEGGGCLDFIRRHISGDPFDWLRKERLIEGDALIATFDYRDEQDKLLFQVCRKANKGFWQRQPNGSGHWINEVKGTRRVLYRLPELLASTGIVFIPEGEKHVDALRDLELCATCSPGGAGKWSKEYNECLRGRDVVVLPDNDPQSTDKTGKLLFHPDGRPILPGQDHSEDIARNLSGIARRVRVLMLPNLKPKGDVINWLEAGGLVEELLRLADETPIWEETRPGTPEDGGQHEYELVWAKDVIPRAKDWLWKGHLLRGAMELLTGVPGLGKSQVQLSYTACVSNGSAWPDKYPGKQEGANVILGSVPA